MSIPKTIFRRVRYFECIEHYLLVVKEQILKLHSDGKSYREIQEIVKCSRSLISYYVNPNGKTNMLNRQTKNRFRRRVEYKKLLGGKCQICGYSKCWDALQFHHKNPDHKKFEVSDAIFGSVKRSEQEILEEVKKCSLLCANCHYELHAQTTFI